ncbi:hypothetical protein HanPI659440_Chr12g0460921 [Helianthus annuus]|nr:hypothetical protein HanPI659440_Chr12g0460921 [Helianthus annuus]
MGVWTLESIYIQVSRGCDEFSQDRFLARLNRRTASVMFSTCNLSCIRGSLID